MVVISDTSPINYLCQLGRIDVLAAIFEHVVVPRAVADELSRPAAPESVRLFIAAPPNWIDIREPAATILSAAEVGAGERQAIALACELHADYLIVDDLEARTIAEARKLAVVGTLGVLKIAAARKLVDLRQVLDQLQSKGFYISDKLRSEILGDLP